MFICIMTYDHLIQLADRYGAHTGLSDMTIAKRVGSHSRLFGRLRAGHGCNVTTFNAVLGRFSSIWPEDLQWPSDIPRPKKSKEAA